MNIRLIQECEVTEVYQCECGTFSVNERCKKCQNTWLIGQKITGELDEDSVHSPS